MTALVISAASVAYQDGPLAADRIAGEAFAAGAMLYRKVTDGRWYKAQGDGSAVEAGQDGIGMALSTADAAGARVTVALPGARVAVGTGSAGVVYTLDDTAGLLGPVADRNSTDKVTVAALGIGNNKLLLCWVYDPGSVLG